ncbi:hypothetical protein [Kocuria sp. ZOR0020]|uniref:hypothetical protein n=1 Tax=Kocuria sp. ZOR0020 TaxID=1339234 RepID=UPI000646CF34|nr:hypothetical protein [Kocuria sp. ZOR0020]
MWMLIGFMGGAVISLIARPFTGLKAMLILAIPLVIWWLAYLGVLGPGINNNNHAQYMTTMLGVMFGVGVPQLLDWKDWRRNRNTSAET